MGYLPTAYSLWWVEKQQSHGRLSPSNNNHELDTDGVVLERKRASPARANQSAVALIWPVARLLKTSTALLNSAVLNLRDGLNQEQRMAKLNLEEERQILSLRLKNATNIFEWQDAARDLDIITGNGSWKESEVSADFDAPLIEKRLHELDEARTNCDVTRMLYLVRTALSRDLGGMGNISLYRNSYIGTKNLIEKYIDSALDTIRSLVNIASTNITLPDGLETKDVLEQLVYARQAFGRSALLLSGGATFGMNHVGVLKALFESRLLPRIISGSSAGSIVCAVLCTRTDEELPRVLLEFPHGNLAVFEDKDHPEGILVKIRRFLTQGAIMDIKHLAGVMKELLGDMTFQEAYNRSRRILNITVSSASAYELPRLLNYITSPNIMIWSAVAASCSVPLIFSAAPLLAKNPLTGEHVPWDSTPQKWIDGSVDNDIPMTRLAEMFNVNHFIVSQVNPHVIPFLIRDEELISHTQQPSSAWDPSALIYNITELAKGEALHRMHVLAEMGIFPNLVTKFRSVLSQKYSGDITILPEVDLGDIPRMLSNPTTEFMCRTCLAGERATWPKLSRIRNHCAVELELDLAVQQLRARVVFSPSQVNLRRLSTTGGSLVSPERQTRLVRRSPIGSRSRKGSRTRVSVTQNHARPEVWRAASHYGGTNQQRSYMAAAASEDAATLELDSTAPGTDDNFCHTRLPRNKTTSTLPEILTSYISTPNDDCPKAEKNLTELEKKSLSIPQSNRCAKPNTLQFPAVISDYFSGLESEATQDGSISPSFRFHDESSDADDDDEDGNDEIDSGTDNSSPEPYICGGNSMSGGSGSGGGGYVDFTNCPSADEHMPVPRPVLSPLLRREEQLLRRPTTRGSKVVDKG